MQNHNPRTNSVRKSAQKDFSGHYHKIYAHPDLIGALDELAALNKKENRRGGKSRSALILSKVKSLLRSEAPRLRKAGYAVPESLFSKE